MQRQGPPRRVMVDLALVLADCKVGSRRAGWDVPCVACRWVCGARRLIWDRGCRISHACPLGHGRYNCCIASEGFEGSKGKTLLHSPLLCGNFSSWDFSISVSDPCL